MIVPTRKSTSYPRRQLLPRFFLIALLIATACLAVSRASAAPGARWSHMRISGARIASLAEPAALQTETAAGPWQMTVLDVSTGENATALVIGASQFNESPADGFTYVVAHIRATNAGSQPYRIDGDDFGVAGDSGVVRRFIGAIPPAPALDGTVAPGDSIEGYVVGGAAIDDGNLILLYDSVTLPGSWADTAFALTDGAAIAPVDNRAVKANKIGRDPSNPVGFDTVAATRDWAVEVIQIVWGEDVINLFPASDYRTTALINNDTAVAATWMAFKVRVTNNQTGGEQAYLPVTAFALTDGSGDPVPDVSTLSPPAPDAAGSYLPGATREGWVVFDPIHLDVSLLRFLPFRTDEDPRYFTWSGGGVTDTEPSFSGTLAVGAKVTVSEDQVRMREQPSTDAGIVAELGKGTTLTVTGAPEEGSGFTWYPVKNDATGETGYIAQQFLDLVE